MPMLERAISKAGWKRVAFGDVVRKVNDKVDPWDSGLERYVAGEHMDTDDLRIRRWGLIGDDYLGPAFHMRFKPGHVLYGSRRTYLRKVALADFEGITANTTFVLETKDHAGLMPELLPFLMQTESFHSYSIKHSKGSVNPYINFSDLEAFEFLLPPIQEQSRLVETLVASRESVESTIALRQTLDILKLSLIFAFEKGVSLADMKSFSSAIQRMEAGKSPSSSGEVASENEFGVLKVSAVGDWSYVETENKVISEGDFLQSAEVRAGDFLATRANADPDSVGRTCIVEATRSGLMLSDKTWRLVLKEAVAPYSIAVLGWTKSRAFRKHVRNQLNGTDAKNVSQKAFLAAPFPPIDDAFVQLDRHIRELEQRRKEALKRELFAMQQHSKILGEALTQ